MGQTTRWNNLPGFVVFELDNDESGHLFVFNGPPEKSNEEWAEILIPILGNPPPGMLEINFLSSGYNDPGRSYGPPERCYPPEGDDERIFDEAVYYFATATGYGKPSKFCDAIGQKVFDAIEDAVATAELRPTD